MDHQLTLAQLKRLIRREFGRTEQGMAPEATFQGSLMFDGLDLVDLVFFIEQEFQLRGRLAPIEARCTLDGLAQLILAQSSQAA